MPFQSEKQRKYLWANEPEIARDWSDTYGSRVKKQLGGILDIAYHGSPRSQDILSQGFKGSRVPTWAGFGKTFTSPSMNVATRYGTPIEVAQSARNFRLPFGGGIGKGGVSFGAETPLKPGQATKGMNLIQKLRAGQYLNSPTAQRLLKTGTTAMGSAGGGMFNAFTSLGTSGLPLAYVLGASKLQESLPMSLIGPGGIAEQNPYFGAMGVSVDPKIEETLRYGDDGKPFPDTKEGSILAKDDDENGTIPFDPRNPQVKKAGFTIPPMLMKWMKAKVQSEGIGLIADRARAKNLAKKKAAMRQQVADAERQRLQAKVTAQANRGAAERVARGEGRDYGHTQTRSSSGWRSSPFAQGGRIGFFKGAQADTAQGKAMSPGTSASGGSRHDGGGGWSPGGGGTQHIPTPKIDPKPDKDVWNIKRSTPSGWFGGPSWRGPYVPGADLNKVLELKRKEFYENEQEANIGFDERLGWINLSTGESVPAPSKYRGLEIERNYIPGDLPLLMEPYKRHSGSSSTLPKYKEIGLAQGGLATLWPR